ncbi:TraM recognition domain-containing protein [Fibrella sp. HMF5036]|uniref:TraM recognition domain-containing protein n=2 Tax=Fibrella aquatilis TaxID=2817059 RepID=A0A939G4E4_9BACT|nr:TraM recognition domain-containing protein [Fibrella aquatilis]
MAEMTAKQREGHTQTVELFIIVAVGLLLLHCLWFCHELTQGATWLRSYLYSFLSTLNNRMGLFRNPFISKAFVLLLLFLYAVGSKGKIDPTIGQHQVLRYTSVGLLLFIGSIPVLYAKTLITPLAVDVLYIGLTIAGTMQLIKGGQYLSRILFMRSPNDIFNDTNEEFPQNETLVQNEFSIHFQTTYFYKGQWRRGLINVVNPFRSNMVLGLQGSGKSFAVLIQALWQSLFKGYTAYIYDFKFPDLTEEAYNAYRKTLAENTYAWTPADQLAERKRRRDPVIPKFYVLNFDDIEYSHRCNPIDADGMTDVMDAYEAAQTVMLNLNRTWAQKQGEFFPESAINFLTSVLWYLRTITLKYRALLTAELAKPETDQNPDLIAAYQRLANCCTFPHTLEFINRQYNETFALMEQYPEVEIYVRPFIDARDGGAMEQLEGQISSVRIPMARLSSPTLYWVMTGNDFSLDINNPNDPKILCSGNNPDRTAIYGTAFSLYTARLMKLVNRKGRLKSALFWDELPTMFLKGLDLLIATARSNRVATWLGIQDFEQLTRDYGEKEAKVIMNLGANVFSGTVVYETAEKLSRRFGKTNQAKESITYSKNDTTINVSQQLTEMIPAAKISRLKQGEFVGQFMDNFGEEQDLKTFKCFIGVETEQMKKPHKLPPMLDLNALIHDVYGIDPANLTPALRQTYKAQLLQDNYKRVKEDIQILVDFEVADFGIVFREKKI